MIVKSDSSSDNIESRESVIRFPIYDYSRLIALSCWTFLALIVALSSYLNTAHNSHASSVEVSLSLGFSISLLSELALFRSVKLSSSGVSVIRGFTELHIPADVIKQIRIGYYSSLIIFLNSGKKKLAYWMPYDYFSRISDHQMEQKISKWVEDNCHNANMTLKLSVHIRWLAFLRVTFFTVMAGLIASTIGR